MAEKESDGGKGKKETPKTWESPKDARSEKGAGKYPNFYSKKTRSGHVFMIDDSKDNEHITLQHRSGSMFQFKPDGAVQFVSHNGQYNVVFGENRMKITGAQDVTVEGAASMKVDGDYNMTIKGDVNMTTHKDFNVTAKNFNQAIRGNIDVQAKNQTTKLEGSLNMQAQEAVSIQSGKGLSIMAQDSAVIGGKGSVGIEAKGGDIRLKASDKISAESGGTTVFKSGGKFSIDAAGDLAMKMVAFGVDASDAIIARAASVMRLISGAAIHAAAPARLGVFAGSGSPDEPSHPDGPVAPADIPLKTASIPGQEGPESGTVKGN
jgi:hypothetical protein